MLALKPVSLACTTASQSVLSCSPFTLCILVVSPAPPSQQWGTAEVNKTLKKKTNLLRTHISKVLHLKPGAGQNIAMHASRTARDFFLELISIFLVHSPSLISKTSPKFFLC